MRSSVRRSVGALDGMTIVNVAPGAEPALEVDATAMGLGDGLRRSTARGPRRGSAGSRRGPG